MADYKQWLANIGLFHGPAPAPVGGRLGPAFDEVYRCPKCGTPTTHVCSWVCVERCPKCDHI